MYSRISEYKVLSKLMKELFLIVLSKFSVSSLNLCLLRQPSAKRDVEKFPTIILDLLISPCNFVKIAL